MLRARGRGRGGNGAASSLINGNEGVFVLFGDSLEQHNGVGSATANSEEYSNWSRGDYNWCQWISRRGKWLNWYDATKASKFFDGQNQGISGNETSQMLTRISDVTGINGIENGVVGVGGGTNDLNASRSVSAITTDLRDTYDAILATGAKIIIRTVPPRPIIGTNSWASGGAIRTNWFALCDWMQEQADADPTNIKIVRRDLICSNNDADRTPITAYFNSDNVHFSPLGGHAIATASGGMNDVLATMIDLYTAFPVFPVTGELWTNPTMLGTTGSKGSGFTGDLMDGAAASRSGSTGVSTVCSKEVNPDGGEIQVLTITRDGAGSTATLTIGANAGNIISSFPAAGNWLQGWSKLAYEASPAILGLSLRNREQPSVGSNMDGQGMKVDTGALWPNESISGWQSTPPWQIRSGGTGILFPVTITIDNTTAGTDVIRIYRMHLIPVSDPRADIYPNLFLQEEDETLLLTEDGNYLELE